MEKLLDTATGLDNMSHVAYDVPLCKYSEVIDS